MLIKHIRLKKGTNFCWLTLESDEYFKIHIDLILKYRIKAGIELDPDDFEEILKEQIILDGISLGIRKLSYGMDSISNFRNKLKQKSYDSESINIIIAKLTENGYLNDNKFAIEYAKYLKDKKKYGKSRIIQQLKKKGINDYNINEAIQDFEINEDDIEDIIQISQKKLRLISGKNIEKQKQSLLLFLKNKGYSFNVAKEVIEKLL